MAKTTVYWLASVLPCLICYATTFKSASLHALTSIRSRTEIPQACQVRKPLLRPCTSHGTIDIVQTHVHSGSFLGNLCQYIFSQGNGAPDNVQPAMLKRAGCSRTNHHQFIPYMSKDITDHAQVYQLVKKILRDVFDWLAEKVSTLMSQVRG